uniref:Uncharacterized protein n=1 Tax=Odontella aurita TaxID=265563 RepID=A0A7S4JW71_9STRA
MSVFDSRSLAGSAAGDRAAAAAAAEGDLLPPSSLELGDPPASALLTLGRIEEGDGVSYSNLGVAGIIGDGLAFPPPLLGDGGAERDDPAGDDPERPSSLWSESEKEWHEDVASLGYKFDPRDESDYGESEAGDAAAPAAGNDVGAGARVYRKDLQGWGTPTVEGMDGGGGRDDSPERDHPPPSSLLLPSVEEESGADYESGGPAGTPSRKSFKSFKAADDEGDRRSGNKMFVIAPTPASVRGALAVAAADAEEEADDDDDGPLKDASSSQRRRMRLDAAWATEDDANRSGQRWLVRPQEDGCGIADVESDTESEILVANHATAAERRERRERQDEWLHGGGRGEGPGPGAGPELGLAADDAASEEGIDGGRAEREGSVGQEADEGRDLFGPPSGAPSSAELTDEIALLDDLEADEWEEEATARMFKARLRAMTEGEDDEDGEPWMAGSGGRLASLAAN